MTVVLNCFNEKKRKLPRGTKELGRSQKPEEDAIYYSKDGGSNEPVGVDSKEGGVNTVSKKYNR